MVLSWRCVFCTERQPEPESAERPRHNSTATDDLLPPPMDVDLSSMRNVSRRDEIPEVTFDVTGREFNQQHAPLEDSLPDRPLDDEIPDHSPVTCEVVDSGTKRGAPKVISSDGVKSGGRQDWRCAIRNKKVKCPADPGAGKKVKIAKRVKEVAKEQMFEPAAAIVERVMKDLVSPEDVNLPKPDNLTRAANHHRHLRPENPTDLKFEVSNVVNGKV